MGRRARLKIEFRKECWFESGQGHHFPSRLRNIIASAGCIASSIAPRSRPARSIARGFAMLRSFLFATLSAVALTSASITGATENAAPKSAQVTSDIPDKFTIPNEDADYDKRVEMIPMRDGTKLYTVIVVPRSEEHTSELPSLMRISYALL